MKILHPNQKSSLEMHESVKGITGSMRLRKLKSQFEVWGFGA
jgi:hypothetical protein